MKIMLTFLSYNAFMILAGFQSILQHNCHIGINKPVVIGVSGGPDSLCLLDLLSRLQYLVIVAHFNHGLRGSANEEADRVRMEANSRNLPFIVQTVNVRALAEVSRLSLEEAARIARYKFLFDQARLFGAQAVAVAHHADDQVETVLMHLLRGAGLSGLRGMDYCTVIKDFDDNIPLVRPLLGYWREEINAYIAEQGLVPAYDESNQDRQYLRNRLRLELLPELESYNPQVRRAIFRMANILRGDYEIIENAIDAAWETCLAAHGQGYAIFSADKLRSQPLGIQSHILRRGIDLLRPGLHDVDYGIVDRALAALHNSQQSKTGLAEGLYGKLEEDRYILASYGAEFPSGDWPQIPSGDEYWLDVPGECCLLNGWLLRSEYVEDSKRIFAAACQNTDPYQAWINIDAIDQPISVRGRRSGDRFRPLGMDGHSIKLSDFMINNKIPSRARDRWPLLISGGEIIWIPGYRQGHRTRVQSDTQKVVHLALIGINKGCA